MLSRPFGLDFPLVLLVRRLADRLLGAAVTKPAERRREKVVFRHYL